ncbi:hypothetical protein L7F22_039737 [Adiantum nelumboides]|nr:hypothetical protein [Adiantum nelumboides]
MHLRSGAYIRSRNRPIDIESRGSTEESVNQGNLEHLSTIHEVVSDTSSEPSVSIIKENIHASGILREDGVYFETTEIPRTPPKLFLQHLYDNQKGARIYLNVNNVYYVQENLGSAECLKQVEVELRGDHCFDNNGTAYIQTEYPELVDSMGMINEKGKGKYLGYGEETSERPPLENDVKAKFLSIKELERVIADNPRMGLYKMATAEGVLY